MNFLLRPYSAKQPLSPLRDELTLPRLLVGICSIRLQQQSLEVFTFRKGQIDRMIGGALQAFDNTRRPSRIAGGTGDNLLEQFDANTA
jgi:hypothetical protein